MIAERKSILIIDDLVENLRLLVHVLQREGYHVRPVRDALRGLSTAQAESPDLILLDIQMPEINGYEICRRLKADEHTRDIPVIFLSALTDTADKVRGFEAGAVDYVTKPIEEAELLARVNTHLALRSLLANEMEIERLRAMGQMVAGVAHELNTPLGIANTAADMIHKRLMSPRLHSLLEADPTLARDVEKMCQAADLLIRNIANAHRLVENFKKISVNQLTENTETRALPDLIREIVNLFQINAHQAKLEIDIQNDLAPTDTTWVGYPGNLSQVVLNLLANIERYAYPNGDGGRVQLHIATTTIDGQPGFALTVRDWGKGMPAEYASRIFEPFFTTGRAVGGTGLGMSIVHNIVITALQGHIAIDSAVGKGTAVRITFPRTITPAPT